MLKKIFSMMMLFFGGVLVGGVSIGIKKQIEHKKETSRLNKNADKFYYMFLLMNQWVKIKQQGIDIVSYFKEEKYKKVIIYGMNYVGERLWNDLKNSDIEVLCGIDQNAKAIISDLPIITKDEHIPQADVIVVTAISAYDEIEDELSKCVDCNIISIEDIIYSL